METFAFHLMPYQDIQDSMAWPFEKDSYDPEKGEEYYETYLDQLEYAAELGIDGLGVNEHHYAAYGLQPSPNLTAANLIARTQDLDTTIAFFGNIAAIRKNPVRLAEAGHPRRAVVNAVGTLAAALGAVGLAWVLVG